MKGAAAVRAGAAATLRPFGADVERGEDLESVAERVRAGVQNINANYMELGRELRTVRERLCRDKFLSWIRSACGLSPRIARSMIRAADQALSAPATPKTARRTELSWLEPGKRLTPKDMIRAAKEHKPTPREQNRSESDDYQQGDGERAHQQWESAKSQSARLRAGEAADEGALPTKSLVTGVEVKETSDVA
jgi:hypothetical protein